MALVVAPAVMPALNPPPAPFGGLHWRLIGPYRGGRVLAVTGVAGNPLVFYFGAVAGGVWKTTDGGLNWKPLFQHEAVSSIGAIAVAPSNPNVIYVGTGEACIRGDISYGDGVWKSLDGGKTWQHLGLDDTQHIGRLIVDPHDPDRVFVAALGHAFGPNAERGVFRTLDGGKTWQKVLFKDDHTGAIDLSFDPHNSNIVFAALWQAQRYPWGLDSGGPGSGLYKSTDGGTTWKHLEGNGLPEGVLGRIGVAVSGADGDRVYALIEAKNGGLYVSSDGGDSWRLANGGHELTQRAWYFTHVFADPKSVDTVYVLNTNLLRSTDAGQKFQPLRAPHGDNHGLWIDPTDPQRMINGNDGGATITQNGGQSWTTEDNQPTAEFYHVATDNRFRFFVYGAQQDNSTVAIASSTDHGGITDSDWYDVGGGESGFVVPDPADPDIVYAGSYDGLLTRYDRRTEQERDIDPWPDNPMGAGAAGLKHRFQWTAPILVSNFAPHALYFGGEVLFKSVDGGGSWKIISPDLTRNDKRKQQSSGGPITQDNTSVEYYDTIFAIAESPLRQGELWVGSDDGLLHLSREDGGQWTDVTPRQMPEWTKISMIEPSHFDPGAAYVAANGEKLDDFHPYIYKTADYGRSWTPIVTGLPADIYVHVVREDPLRRGLLYAGTEQGVYYSLDDGGHWQSLQLGLPTTPVRDLAVHGTTLIAATHGRAFWALDDITPLRQYQDGFAAAAVHLYQPAVAYRARGGFGFARPGVGANPPGGAIVDYWLAQAPQKPITLEILDAHGTLVRQYTSTSRPAAGAPGGFRRRPAAALQAKAGLNRFVWDLRYPAPHLIPGEAHWGSPSGVRAAPGDYQVRLIVGAQAFTQPIVLKADPRLSTTQADYEKQFDLAQRINRAVGEAHDAVNQMRGLQKQLAELDQRIGSDHRAGAALAAAKTLDGKLGKVVAAVAQLNSKSGEDALNYPIRLDDKLDNLLATVESADMAPTAQSYAVFTELNGQLQAQLSTWRTLQNKDLAALNELIRKDGVMALSVPALAPAGASREVVGSPQP
ncbi:MAG: WD40/YVTN/BNR-like repeat-containing protein [Terriglobales bacterium]